MAKEKNVEKEVTCPDCSGSGLDADQKLCPTCEGSGRTTEEFAPEAAPEEVPAEAETKEVSPAE